MNSKGVKQNPLEARITNGALVFVKIGIFNMNLSHTWK